MRKTFKEFRGEWDDEWVDDDDHHNKDMKLQARRNQRKKKAGDRASKLDGNETQEQ